MTMHASLHALLLTAAAGLPAPAIAPEPAAPPAAPAGVEGELEVSLQKLMNIDWNPGDKVPEEISAYDGQTVKITGFMRNGTTEGGSWFDLIDDACGCGTGKIQHFVRVTLENGTTTFSPAELTLTGTLEVSEKEDEDGFVESLYRLKIDRLDL